MLVSLFSHSAPRSPTVLQDFVQNKKTPEGLRCRQVGAAGPAVPGYSRRSALPLLLTTSCFTHCGTSTCPAAAGAHQRRHVHQPVGRHQRRGPAAVAG